MAASPKTLIQKSKVPSFARPGFSPLSAASSVLNTFMTFSMPLALLGFGASGLSRTPRVHNATVKNAAGGAAGFLGLPMKNLGEIRGAGRVCAFAENTLHMNLGNQSLAGMASLGAAGLSTVHLTKDTWQKAKVVQHMCAAAGHKVTMWQAIRGKVPEPFASMHKLSFPRQGISALLQCGLIGGSVALQMDKLPFLRQVEGAGRVRQFMTNPYTTNMMMSGLYAIPAKLGETQFDAISAYKEAHKAVAKGAPISQEAYVHMVAASGVNPQYGKQMIETFSKEQTHPEAVMKQLYDIVAQSQKKPILGLHTGRATARSSAPPQLSPSLG